MTREEPDCSGKTIYTSRVRYHTKNYPYRIALENRREELVIQHQYLSKDGWRPSHSIGLRRKDLARMLQATKKRRKR